LRIAPWLPATFAAIRMFGLRAVTPAPGGGEGVELPFEPLPAGLHSRVPDLDLGADERFCDEECGMLGRGRKVTHDPGHVRKQESETVEWA
jgi:hypothetical protein